MKNENNTSIYEFLKKLEIRLADFTKTQHYNICFYMKDDIKKRDKAININNELTQNFKNIQKKYFQYLENRGTQPFEEITPAEFNAYSLALSEENNSLERITFKSLETVDNNFSTFKCKIIDEIEENLKSHNAFMVLIRNKDI